VVDSNAIATQFVDRLLSESNYMASVLGIPRSDASQLSIVDKVKKAMKDNQDWFMETMKELKSGKPMPYHKNLSIREDDYVAFMQFTKSIKINKVNSIALKIIHSDNIIHFEPKDLADYLKYVVIHLNNHTSMV